MSAGRLNVLLTLEHFDRPCGRPRLRALVIGGLIAAALWLAIGWLVT